jgi:hypothetical protein
VFRPFLGAFLVTIWTAMSTGGLIMFLPLVYGAFHSQVRDLCWSRKWC